MIKTVNEGVDLYKAALGEYKALADQLNAQYDALCGKGKWSAFGTMTTADLQEVEKAEARIEAMAEALGLTPEEIAAIDREIGIKPAEELNVA